MLVLTTFELDESMLLGLHGASAFLGKGAAPAELLTNPYRRRKGGVRPPLAPCLGSSVTHEFFP